MTIKQFLLGLLAVGLAYSFIGTITIVLVNNGINGGYGYQNHPKFKVGDCLQDERWFPVLHIIEVGHHSYRFYFEEQPKAKQNSIPFSVVEPTYYKVDCK